MNVLHAPQDTRPALQPLALAHCSRSLYFDRYARPEFEKDDRRKFFSGGFDCRKLMNKGDSWNSWLGDAGLRLKPEVILFAQLQSRLIVNMAGGVMENAGLCLDRFGLPYIPGSAVKGCARRMAIQDLLDTREAGKPAGELGRLLADIALIFGWGEQDWSGKQKEGRFVSDFAYAVGGSLWDEVSTLARGLLPKTDHFAGSVSFLPAYPVDPGKIGQVDDLPLDVPELGKLELDIVTVHHKKYYAGPENPNDPASVQQWEREWSKAPDIEEPVPNVFPAVAAGHVFAFAVLPLRSGSGELLSDARTALANGLATFGLGAKTASGYGWFEDVSAALRAAQDEADRKQANVERLLRERGEREAARSNLQPDLELIEKLRGMKEPDLRGQINPFATEERFWGQKDERVQLTLLHFVLVISPDLFPDDRANPRSKLAKAITNLSAKFPHAAPAKP